MSAFVKARAMAKSRAGQAGNGGTVSEPPGKPATTNAGRSAKVTQDQGDGTQSRIRETIAVWISDRAEIPGVVAADMALGVHPWPDQELSTECRRRVLDEMHPMCNLCHPDGREVVADRLLRLADTLRGLVSDSSVVLGYEQAAHRLASTMSNHGASPDPAVFAAFLNPLGIGPTLGLPLGPPARAGVEWDEEPPDDHQKVNMDLAVSAVDAACRSGSLDLGVILGHNSVGASIALLLDASGLPALLTRFDLWFGVLDARTVEVLRRRVFTFDEQPTLQELGSEWGVSRERVRQLEAKARESVDRVFGPTLQAASRALAPLTRYLLPAQRFIEIARSVGSSMTNSEEVSAAVVLVAGPWVTEDGWTYHQSLAPGLLAGKQAVLATADEHGLLSEDSQFHLSGLFASEEDQFAFFTSSMGVVELFGFWAERDSQRSRVAAALRSIGRPATKAEIAAVAGIDSDGRVGSTLSALPGVVRADKERWALESWVDDPYDGIVAEIQQRIDANAGSVAIAVILDELPRRFGVSESSVHAYLQTTAFHVEDGFVSRMQPGAFEASPPSKWPDAFRHNGVWGQRVRVEQRHFEGYSMKVRFDIAYANGIRPGDELRVRAVGTTSLVSVIWREHDATRAVDVGRVAEALRTMGLVPGQEVLLCPSPSEVVFARADEIPDEPNLTLVDLEIAVHDPLLDLLGEL